MVRAASAWSAALAAAAALAGCERIAGLHVLSRPDPADALPAGDAVVDATPTDALVTCSSADLMTSPRHCGRCGHDCLAGTCTDGVCDPFRIIELPLDNGVPVSPRLVDVHARRLFAVNHRQLVVCDLTRLGGTAVCAPDIPVYGAATNGGAPFIGADDDGLFILRGNNTIRCPLDGCGGRERDVANYMPEFPVGVILTGNFMLTATTNIYRHTKTGPAVATIGTVSGATDLATDGTNLYVLDNDRLYTCSVAQGCAGGARLIATGPRGGSALRFFGGYLYWTTATNTSNAGRIVRCLPESCFIEDIAMGQADPLHLYVDADGVFWTNNNAGTVAYCPVARTGPCGTNPIILARQQAGARGIDGDELGVYWANSSGRSLWGIAKP